MSYIQIFNKVIIFKSKRIPQNYMLPTPGAGSYNITGKLQTRKDFNYANSSSFHLPIAVKTKDLGITQHNDVTPAPNIYTVSNLHFNDFYFLIIHNVAKIVTKYCVFV